jgi:23S rRNA (pseudouridine1915-N3)-methyltransferase
LGITLAFIENHKNPLIDGLCDEYEKKTKGVFLFKRVKLSGAKKSSIKEQRYIETQKICDLKKSGDFLLLCDERGKSYDSVGLTKFFEKQIMHIPGNLIIGIGGAYGFTQEALQEHPSWKLSDLVFPHHIARLLVCEQLYRCQQINIGTGYHHI